MRTVFLLYIIIQSNICFAQNFKPANSATDRIISKLVKESNIAGLSIAVSHKDSLVWNKSYGYSNLEHNIPTSEKSKFRIASVSKLLTGTAIYKLHKQELINLQDPISKYLDSIPNSWENITIEQIAQHTSGIGHYIDENDALDVHYYQTTDEALKKFKDRPLVHNPDEDVTYSSYAYTVLAAIIESVTKKSFQNAMKDLVFKPLKMNQTEVDDQKKIIINRTGFYQYNTIREPEHSPFIDLSAKWAGSGYLSTAIDLVKFGSAHTFNSSYLTREDLNILTSPRTLNDTLKTKEGLGWGQRTSWDDEMMYWGDGRTPGSTCGLLVFPEYNLSIAIVSNMRHAPIERSEFELLSKRYIAAIKGEKISELKIGDVGNYKLDISIQENIYNGKLDLFLLKDNYGSFNFHEAQNFPISDAFWRYGKLWIYAIGGGKQPISVGVLPIKLDIEENKVSGEIFRINANVLGIKQVD